MLFVNPTAGGLFGGGIEVQRVEFAMTSFNQQIGVSRLQVRQIDPALLSPVAMDMQDLSTPAQRAGAFASLMLPLLVGIIAAQGGMFIAIDVTAGEKERGTLEALLVTPTSDMEIFVGKLSAVFTMTLAPIVLTLMGYWVGSNQGLDFTAPQGTPIYATGDGVVTTSGFNAGAGNEVVINHGYGYETKYLHMVRIKARSGQRVKRGEVIGWVGNTGASTGPHCHYEVHINGNPVNPVYFFFNDLNAAQYDQVLKIAATGSAKSFD